MSVLLLSMLIGCKSGEIAEEKDATDLTKLAHAWADQRGFDVSTVLGKKFPDGTLHHIEFVAKGSSEKLGAKLAMKPDGTVLPLSQAKAQYDSRYLKRWGRVDPSVVSIWEQSETPILVAVTLSNITTEVVEEFREFDPQASFSQTPFNHVYATLTFDDWLKLKDSDSVIRVDFVGFGGESYADPDSESSSHHTRSASRFNDNGYFASGVNVGILENSGRGCGVWEDHEAFQYNNSIIHQDDQSCSVSTDCNCGFTGGNAVCLNGVCIKEHATAVSGGISHSSQNPNHAAEANLFIANEGDVSMHPLYSPADARLALVTRYNWLLSNEVFLVNESWGYESFYNRIEQVVPTFRDSLHNFYARFANLTIIRAAGNSDNPFDEVDCHSLNSICVGAVNDNNSIYNSQSQYLDDTWSGYAYKNPFTQWTATKTDPETDIERPDVAAAGINVPITSLTGTQDWTDGDGTSFSAPAVTGTLALLQECRGGEPLSPILNRAIIRNSASVNQEVEHGNAFAPNPVPLYPPADTDWKYDSRIGAGIHHAAGLSCDPNDPDGCGEGIECGDTELEISLDEAEPMDSSFFGPAPLLGAPTTSSSADGMNLLVRDSTIPNKSQWRIKTFEGVTSGSRVRAELAWYACSPNDTQGGINQLGVGIDIDLILCAPGIGCEAASESMYDNSEGFDVIVTDDYESLSLYAVWDNERLDQNGTPFPNVDCSGSTSTRMAAAWRVKRL